MRSRPGSSTGLSTQVSTSSTPLTCIPAVSPRRSWVGRCPAAAATAPYSMLVRGIEAEVLPVCAGYRIGVITWSPLAGGWLSGRWRKGRDAPESTRAGRLPQRYDLSVPGNLAKLDAADRLAVLADKAGISLVHMAIAFVLEHPAVTSAIIGPRTMEQLESQLGAADLVLDADLLDQIDDVVPPGTNLNADDNGWLPPPIVDPALRRRQHRR